MKVIEGSKITIREIDDSPITMKIELSSIYSTSIDTVSKINTILQLTSILDLEERENV